MMVSPWKNVDHASSHDQKFPSPPVVLPDIDPVEHHTVKAALNRPW